MNSRKQALAAASTLGGKARVVASPLFQARAPLIRGAEEEEEEERRMGGEPFSVSLSLGLALSPSPPPFSMETGGGRD